MNNNEALTGITYQLDGQTVTIHATRPSDRVRILRVAVARGATNITVWTNGSGMAA